MLGVMTTQQALREAEERGLDLVEVNPKATPPVCKILDFGKFKYEEKKRAREAKRKQTVVEVKEIKLRPKTDDHDLDTKLRAARRFIESGQQGEVHRALPRPRDRAPAARADAARLAPREGRRPRDRRAAAEMEARAMSLHPRAEARSAPEARERARQGARRRKRREEASRSRASEDEPTRTTTSLDDDDDDDEDDDDDDDDEGDEPRGDDAKRAERATSAESPGQARRLSAKKPPK